MSRVGVVDKAVAVLGALADQGPATLAELATATGLARPTAHRLAQALECHGLVGRDPAGRFRLGLRLLAWGARAASGLELVELAGPVLANLRDATDESAQLYVREADRRVCVATAERRSGLRDTVPVGASLPLTAGSGAKVLLAWASPEDRPPGLDPDELAAVRKRGWAASVGEREPGVASVSAPVLDAAGRVLAAVSVSGPADRLAGSPGRRYAPALVAAARDLEQRAGLLGPDTTATR
ncbi:MAG: IclR family transcriptional regulator [Acidimicrobiia bacterium]|nr:IclR family transcriptional regulator [Acidimicrobiia bacterium]